MLKPTISPTRLFAGALAAFAALALASPAQAELYRWRTESGAYAFTDDLKRVPQRYRDQVVGSNAASLDDYSRYTHVQTRSEDDVQARTERRLEALRRLNAPPPVASAPFGSEEVVTIRPGGTLSNYQVSASAGEGPIIIERVRTRAPGTLRTRRVTVIRQGSKVLSVIKPNEGTNSGLETVEEDELLSGDYLD